MKKVFLSIALVVTISANAQVGINTETPKATLDVKGKPTDANIADGIIAPWVTRAELTAKNAVYDAPQNGTLIYVTTLNGTATGKTINVTTLGYYYFDGALWQKLLNARDPDLRLVGNNNHITVDAGTGSTGTSAGSGARNILIGDASGNAITSGNNNIGIGGFTFNTLTNGSNNTAIGVNALRNTNGLRNVAIGNAVLQSNTSGNENTSIGERSQTSSTTASANTSVGERALQNNLTGSNNTAVGSQALLNTTAGTNTALGRLAGSTLTSGTGNIFIGHNVQPNVDVTASNQLNIGNWIYGDNGYIGVGISKPGSWLHVGGTRLASNTAVTTIPDFKLILYSGSAGNVYQINRTEGFTVRNSATGQGGNESNMGLHSSYRFEFFDAGATAPYVSIQPGTGGSASTTYPGGISKQGVGINTGVGEIKASLHVIKNAADLTPAVVEGCNVYADNAAAVAAGLPVGGIYRTATGQLMIVY